MRSTQSARALASFAAFVDTPLDALLADRGSARDAQLALFRDMVETVPAYAAFLREHGVDASGVVRLVDLARIPLVTKSNYLARYPLAERCRSGLASCDMIAVSSGSTGEPSFWPRFVADEFAAATRFEQVLRDAFEADRRTTLAVICFPLGTWVGGMFTTSCCRHLAAKGYPLTLVTPGNNKAEILRAVRALAPMFAQTVLFGYPPFLKEVVDTGLASGIAWRDHDVKLVLAGEVFSEEWRSLIAERAGIADVANGFASLYGTADAGVLGNETPLSITIRRYLAEHPNVARELFGEERLPTLVQYDPCVRHFEEHEGTLVVSGDNGVPLMRYHISDKGGVIPYDAMLTRLAAVGLDVRAGLGPHIRERARRPLPFVYIFGRSHFAISFYGANVFPETVSMALERRALAENVTGKFVLEVRETNDRDHELHVVVELAPGRTSSEELADAVAEAVRAVLIERNSEFANYVPDTRKRPIVALYETGDPTYFPPGVKHRYSRKS